MNLIGTNVLFLFCEMIISVILFQDHDEVSKKHEVMQVEYDELLLKTKGQAFHVKQLKVRSSNNYYHLQIILF